MEGGRTGTNCEMAWFRNVCVTVTGLDNTEDRFLDGPTRVGLVGWNSRGSALVVFFGANTSETTPVRRLLALPILLLLVCGTYVVEQTQTHMKDIQTGLNKQGSITALLNVLHNERMWERYLFSFPFQGSVLLFDMPFCHDLLSLSRSLAHAQPQMITCDLSLTRPH